MDNATPPAQTPQDTPVPALPEVASSPPSAPASSELTEEQKRVVTLVVIGIIFILAVIIGSVYFLALPTTDTARIRDIFIIFMAVQSLLMGFVLVILVVQLARLINLLQNEVKPILDSTNETVNNLRGTTIFLSDNLTEPVIKLNEYLAGLTQALKALGFIRSRK